MFIEVKGTSVCLLCGDNVLTMKEYNIRPYETLLNYKEKYKNMDMKQKLLKVKELKRSLKYKHAMFTKANTPSEAAAKASFIVAEEVAKSGCPFAEGKFVKHCVLKVCDAMCLKKATVF